VAPDGTFVFLGSNGQTAGLMRVGADGANRQLISSGSGLVLRFKLIPGGVLYCQFDGFVPHIWRAGASGDGPGRVTDGPGENLQDASPDDARILFVGAPDLAHLLAMPLEGGERFRISEESDSGDFSPDGKLIRYSTLRKMGEFLRTVHVVVPAMGGEQVASLTLPELARDDRWTADSKALAFVLEDGGFDNIYRKPIAGGEPTAITHFKTGRVGAFSFSRDGSRLQMTRSLGPVTNVWVMPAAGGEPVQVTSFKTGTIFSVVWGHDGKTLFLTYGDVIQDVVLIRDFK
jgi:Tol biopolymer transport system component